MTEASRWRGAQGRRPGRRGGPRPTCVPGAQLLWLELASSVEGHTTPCASPPLRAPVVALPRRDDGWPVPLRPRPDGSRRLAQGRPEVGEGVLDMRRRSGELLADDDAVTHQFPEGISQ